MPTKLIFRLFALVNATSFLVYAFCYSPTALHCSAISTQLMEVSDRKPEFFKVIQASVVDRDFSIGVGDRRDGLPRGGATQEKSQSVEHRFDAASESGATRCFSNTPAVVQLCAIKETELEGIRKLVSFESSIDGTQQQAFVIEPQVVTDKKPMLVVNLHSWSADLNQRSPLEKLVSGQGWFYLFPNFRGANQTPAACGSKLAQQDILDSIDFVIKKYSLDSSRVFLTGSSGGGHMTMLMAGLYPERWKAASAWVGISDLVSWHQKHRNGRYGKMIEKCCGGVPGESTSIDSEYRKRSPIHVIAGAAELPIEILAGIDDGHKGSVPIRHSIDAFNRICKASGNEIVTEKEIQELSKPDGRLQLPKASDLGFDRVMGRRYFLRRYSGSARLTIFDGGHESIAESTISWFSTHQSE